MSVENKLPEGWVLFSLNDISKLPGGKTPSKSNPEFWKDGNILWVSPKDMKTLTISDSGDKITELAITKGGMPVYPISSILFVVRSGILKHSFPVAIAEKEATINQDLKAITPVNGIETKFLFQLLRASSNQILGSCSKAGTTVNSVDLDALGKLALPLPPLAEQQVIADQLDTLLAQVEATKTRLERIPDVLKRFRQSVLAAAVSGKLTEGWKNENTVGAWKSLAFGDLINSGPQNGIYKPTKNYGSGNKIIRIDSFYDSHVCDFDKIKRVSIDEQELTKWQLKINDILINRVNSIEYLGKSALIRDLPEPTVFESNIMRLSVNTKMANPEFISIYLRSSFGTDELRKNAKLAVNQASINQGDVKACNINLPPLSEQQEIVRRVEQLFAYADSIERQVEAAQQRVNQLTQSILAKAFRGELTADWRAANPELISGDNSAEALLARIREERAAQLPKKRAPRKKKPSA